MWWNGERCVKDLFITTALAPKEGIRRSRGRQEGERGQGSEPHPVTHSFLAGRVPGKSASSLSFINLTTCAKSPGFRAFGTIKLTVTHLLQTSQSPGKLIPAHAASNVEDAPRKSACISSRGVAHTRPHLAPLRPWPFEMSFLKFQLTVERTVSSTVSLMTKHKQCKNVI